MELIFELRNIICIFVYVYILPVLVRGDIPYSLLCLRYKELSIIHHLWTRRVPDWQKPAAGMTVITKRGKQFSFNFHFMSASRTTHPPQKIQKYYTDFKFYFNKFHIIQFVVQHVFIYSILYNFVSL